MNAKRDRAAATADRAAGYGASDTTPLWMTGIDHADVSRETFHLRDPRVERIVRLRLLSCAGWSHHEVSYCYGQINDNGRRFLAHVNLGDDWIKKAGPRAANKGHLIQLAQAAGRYAKGLGLLDNSVISILGD